MKAAVVPAMHSKWEIREVPRPEPGPNQVLIKIRASGICYTDVHQTGGALPGAFPRILGHEPVGEIVAIGLGVTTRKVGDRVGVPWIQTTCGRCEWCKRGKPMFCEQQVGTGGAMQGGHAEYMLAYAGATVLLPDALPYEQAAPIFCAGYTVWSGLRWADPQPSERVAVVGIGGLGHLAVQFAHAWGAEVTAFSNSVHKQADIRKLGADYVVSSRDTGEWTALKGKFDLILITVAVPLDWDKIIAMLAPKGRLHFVGIVYEPIPISVLQLLLPQASVSSSPGGTRSEIGKMLGFAARHHIAPVVEHFPMSRINEAIAYVESGKANYRVVLDADFTL